MELQELIGILKNYPEYTNVEVLGFQQSPRDDECWAAEYQQELVFDYDEENDTLYISGEIKLHE